ncbi:rIIB-like protein [Alteromonas phage vB_AemP_PT15-A5]|nr:rIIB-like protein [Alteromonas phage vB_AemP_PT15-A5]
MTTQKQAQIEARNNKIIRAWQKELANPTGVTKAAFAAQFDISPRQLNRILDENGVPKNPEKQPTAAVSPKKETKKSAAKKKTAKKKVSKKPAATAPKKEKAIEPVEEVKEEPVKAEEVDETPDVTVVSWTITSDKFISCMLSDGEPISIETSHENYSKIAALLIADQLDEAVKLMSLKKKLQALNIRGFEISSKGIKLNGTSVHNDVVSDIVGVFERQEPVEHLVKFLENLMLSANPAVYKNLYLMLKHAGMRITEEGNVECFKRVDRNFKDCYTHTIDNSVGTTVTMLRSDVDADQSRTCSAGLHVCAFKYLTSSNYGGAQGAKVVKVSVRPQDFVAIPPDYEFTKARTCQYTVLKDVTEEANRGDFDAA